MAEGKDFMAESKDFMVEGERYSQKRICPY